MAYVDGPFIILSPEEMKDFHYQILHPDSESIARRDAFFAEIDAMEIVEWEDGVVEIADPELDRAIQKRVTAFRQMEAGGLFDC